MLATTSVGRKLVMAVTGIGLFLFVVGHLAGNLLIYAGPDALNAYALKLKEMPYVVWPARLVILSIFLVHIYLGLELYRQNREARPDKYFQEETLRADFASRHMLFTGLMILLFVVYHLLQFTFHAVPPPEHIYTTDLKGKEVTDVYTMVVQGFQTGGVSAIYILAQVFLALHLSHAMTSVFETFGWTATRFRGYIEKVGPIVATVICFGYITIPLAVLTGNLRLPDSVIEQQALEEMETNMIDVMPDPAGRRGDQS
ncbi:hypothetical protein Pan216_40400 [Planctomycetes bacterium Pan216]|uniref:Succinate dehydrogenase/Fumarate reductase transmembrane subunit n=1 Tax=Kolteria novifilia TaxID=2527975 RepID=A0A518B863_9BACT|nr:hypothetical protein Pan216_40400 [Planctomycetes bacterium Pan216]